MKVSPPTVIELIVGCLTVAMVVGAVTNTPMVVGIVTSGSMAPTITTGDGFVAVPSALAGDPEPGDVVTFRAQRLEGGGLTTHRIVRETDEGYVTRGDANPFTDQASGEPPVREPQIVAHAATFDGDVIVLPSVGTAVWAVRDAGTAGQRWLARTVGIELPSSTGLLVGVGGLAFVGYGWDRFRNGGEPPRRPDRTPGADGRTPRLLVAGLSVLVVVAATAAMVAPAGVHGFTLLSVEDPADSPLAVEDGGEATFDTSISNGGVVPVHVYLEPASDAVSVESSHRLLGPHEQTTASVTARVPSDPGRYDRYLTEHRYLAVLPESLIAAAMGVHPWLPVVLIDLLLGGVVYLGGVGVVGRSRLRVRERTHSRRSEGGR